MKAMKQFREEIADEILFIIADRVQLPARKLCKEFEKKVGYKLVDFVGIEECQFVLTSPVLSSEQIFLRTPANESVKSESPSVLYTINHSERHSRRTSDQQYREMLLIQVCKLIENDGPCENTGNSALHFLVGIPGGTTPDLVRSLLKAGADPLHINAKGQSILHVIAGRMRAEKTANGDLVFGNNKINQTEWKTKDRKTILDVLNGELSSHDHTVLVKHQDKYGDTAIHEWALSASTVSSFHQDYACDCLEKEIDIASMLLQFGAQLRLPNNNGHVPLHYALNFDVFDFLVERCDVCHVRNDLDETPLMFMIKTIIKQALSPTYVNEYPELTTAFLKTNNPKTVTVNRLTHVVELVEESDTIKNAIWFRDISGNSILDIILLTIKIASYQFFKHPRFINLNNAQIYLKEIHVIYLRRDLVSLLKKIMSIDGIADSRKHQEKENPLHTLLNKHPHIHLLKCNNRAILESLDVLLQHGVEVNAVNADGLTPLDIVYKQFCNKCGSSLRKEIIDKLRQYGARRSLQSFKRQLKSSCSKTHLNSAIDLTEATGKEDNVTVVGKYRYFNDAPIGSGAFSSVFLAIKDEHMQDQSDTIYCSCFALKRIEKAKVNPKEISSEMKSLISFSNKCESIVKYYGVEDSEDGFFQYLCLDLMDGDLNEFVANERVNSVLKENPAMSVQATKEIINGVAYLHDHDVIHRDLKPGNILYTTDPTLRFKIADFGLAKNMSTLSTMTSTGGGGVAMAPGTRCWMAPELVSMKSREHTQQSDIFSLGLVLHYLLTFGKHPFALQTEQPAHVIEKRIADMQIRLDQSLHPEASSFLQMLLVKDSRRRPPAKFLHQHPFLWSERKKIEFLKAVGDQPEAVNPAHHPNSALEQRLQTTAIGRRINPLRPWNRVIDDLYEEMTIAWKQKKYRTDKVIDLMRFIRNAYAHKQERSLETQEDLDGNIFIRVYRSLVLDAFDVVQQLGFDESRSNIKQALSLEIITDYLELS